VNPGDKEHRVTRIKIIFKAKRVVDPSKGGCAEKEERMSGLHPG
jgi:hypothetical protein